MPKRYEQMFVSVRKDGVTEFFDLGHETWKNIVFRELGDEGFHVVGILPALSNPYAAGLRAASMTVLIMEREISEETS